MKKIAEFREYLAGPAGTRIALFVVTAIVMAAAMTSLVVTLSGPVMYRQGEIAHRTLRAPYDIVVEDALETEKRRAISVAAVKTVFATNTNRENEPSQHLNYLFTALREFSNGVTDGDGLLILNQEKRTEIERRFHLDIEGEEWTNITNPRLWPKLEAAVRTVVQPILSAGVIANKSRLIEAMRESGAVLRDRIVQTDVPVLSDATIFDVAEATTHAAETFPAQGFSNGMAFDRLVRRLVALTLQPNIVLDAEETEKRLLRARSDVDATVFRIQRGQVLVRAGDLVTASQEIVLKQFATKGRATGRILQIFCGYLILAGSVIYSLYIFIYTYWPGFRPKPRDLAMIATTLCGSVLLVKLYGVLAEALSYSFANLGPDTFLLAAPVAAGGILLQVTLGPASAYFFTIAFASLTGVFLEDSWLMFLVILCGNIVGATSVKRCSRRSMYIYGGLRVAGIQMLVVSCFLLVSPEVDLTENLWRLLYAAVGGLTSSILAAGLTPVAEYLGGYVSDIKLLELASLDHPLLRELSLQAPGTWNHSMVMGQMVEAASEAVGANPLLARVGAFYHDVGKTKKPAYFAENQTGENRHDKLTPSMSALIIKAHVKDGIEMAIEHRLPQAVLDFIPQHHGNSLIEYFYVKALKDAGEGEEIDETHYRYPGPRPQTKEAGILMLADSIEASSRTLSDPSPAKIQGLVQKMINKVFASGELNECPLTLKDLHKIAKSFTRVLTGIYHRRIEYSEPAEKVRELRLIKVENDVASENPASFFRPPGAEGTRPDGRPEGRAEGGTLRVESGRTPGEAEGGKRTSEGSSRKGATGPSPEALRRLGMQ